ncbi:MAG: PTS sugar transporter subunit IIC [bacterium]
MIDQIVLISFVGSFISLDVMTIWQVMISRPLVTAPVVGWILGDMGTGIIIGIMLELIWINVLPIGTVIPPDVSTSAIIATAQAVLTKQFLPYQHMDVLIMIAVMWAVPLGVIYKKIDIWLRWFNRHFAHQVDSFAQSGNTIGIEFITRMSIAAIFAKTFVFYVIAIWLGVQLTVKVVPVLPHNVKMGLELARSLLPALGFAAVLDIFGSKN